jgi:hypothetical protein
MGLPDEDYHSVVIETYHMRGGGLHGDIHVRTIAGEMFSQNLHVRFSMSARTAHPVGTRFRVRAKLTNMKDGSEFLHTVNAWGYEVLGVPAAR